MAGPLRFFRRLWAQLFGPKPAERAALGLQIPAPATLVGRIQNLEDEDRDMIRIAEEAIRRGFPAQAIVAYGKAAQFYEKKGLLPKALSVLIAMIRLAPEDVDAWLARARICKALQRNSDAARALFQAAALLEAKGENAKALFVLEPCLELDIRTAGLKELYRRLGGTKDPWDLELVPVDGDAVVAVEPRPASIGLPAVVAPVARIHPLSVMPRQVSPSFAPEPVEVSANLDETLNAQTMAGRMVDTDAESAFDLDLDLSSQIEVAPVLPAKIRFSIPNAATAFEPGLPSALIGSEHQAEAESGDLAIPDARTDAYDASVVAGLLARVKQGV